jgi:hypothetical protein
MNRQLNPRNKYANKIVKVVIQRGAHWFSRVLWLDADDQVLVQTVGTERLHGTEPRREHFPGIPADEHIMGWSKHGNKIEGKVRPTGEYKYSFPSEFVL